MSWGPRLARAAAVAVALAVALAACTTSVPGFPTAQPGPSATPLRPGFSIIIPSAAPETFAPATTLPATPPPVGGNLGGIDTSFGNAGLVVVDMGGTDDAARAVVTTPDGGTIVAGEARANAQSLVTFALAKLDASGGLDQSFGTGGKVFTPFGEFNSSGALAVTLQPDGKIVAAGHAANPDAHHDTFAVARYNSDGSLDLTFGDGGLVLTAVWPDTGAGPVDRPNAVAVDTLGRILVAGESGSFMHDFAIARYLADGSLDPSFDADGTLIHDFQGGDDRANSVTLLRDGGILVAGSGGPSAGTDFVLARYLDDGTPDASFGQGGVVLTDFRGGDDVGHTVLVRPDGRILVAGTIQLSGGCSPATCERYGFGLAQYNPDGSPDQTFGTGGRIEPDFITSSGAYDAVLMPNGEVALAGHIGNEDFGLAFVNTVGGPILVEGGSEAVRIDFQGGSDRAFGAALGPNNSIVLAGDASDGAGAFEWGVARYLAPTP